MRTTTRLACACVSSCTVVLGFSLSRLPGKEGGKKLIKGLPVEADVQLKQIAIEYLEIVSILSCDCDREGCLSLTCVMGICVVGHISPNWCQHRAVELVGYQCISCKGIPMAWCSSCWIYIGRCTRIPRKLRPLSLSRTFCSRITTWHLVPMLHASVC